MITSDISQLKGIAPFPLHEGLYVPADNASFVVDSYVYKLRSGKWSQINSVGIQNDAEKDARYAHEFLGGLVPLVPKD